MSALAVRAHGRVRAVFYLHGFASSPKSTKVGYFGDRLRDQGIELRCPDLNQPDFATLTLTRMLGQLGDELAGLGRDRSVLFASSLGGTLAILAAAQFEPQVDRLVLLAPAVMFAKPRHHLLPPERIDEWRRLGRMPFFHYAHGTERDLNVEFYEDSLRRDAFNTEIRQPVLVFQGNA
jgi:pimeloyl-ACP methyl ester carboxylesterase